MADDTVIVFGSTGAQGGVVAQRLAASGFNVRGLGRSKAALSELREENIEAHRLSSFDQSALAEALEGGSLAFVCVPITVGLGTETLMQIRLAICEALEQSSVKRIVWTTSWVVTEPGHRVSDSFDAVRRSVDQILELPQDVVVLKPAGYLDNLLTKVSCQALSDGILSYMLPPDLRYRWISLADQAALTERIFASESIESGEYAIGTLASGVELARAASTGLDHAISYVAISPQDFADQWRGEIGEAADRISEDYLTISANPVALGLDSDPYRITSDYSFEYEPLVDFFRRHVSEFTRAASNGV